jgi:hypothetical protein
MAPSGMLRRVALVRTNVSKELSASIMSVTRIGELRSKLEFTVNVLSSPILVNLIMEALSSSETSVTTRATRRNIPEDAIFHSYGRKILKSYINFFIFHASAGWPRIGIFKTLLALITAFCSGHAEQQLLNNRGKENFVSNNRIKSVISCLSCQFIYVCSFAYLHNDFSLKAKMTFSRVLST